MSSHFIQTLVLLIIFCTVGIVLTGYGNFSLERFKNFCSKSEINMSDMDIYLINLDRNADRLASFVKQYMASDLKFKQFNRIQAVDGKDLGDNGLRSKVSTRAYAEIVEIENSGYRTKHYQLTRGAVGCYLSHLRTYELVANGVADYAMIFEDDVIIDKNIFAKMNMLMGQIPHDWDIMLLSCYCILCDGYKEYYDAEKFFFLHCYVVKKESAAKIVKHLAIKPIEQQVDSELSDMVSAGHIKVYCAKESLCKQNNSFKTEIQTPLKVIPGVNPYIFI
jgi:GR25 family glycosyltransferase involved in LPS biosynthesis